MDYLRFTHLVFNRKNNAYSLKSKNGSSKEDGEFFRAGEPRHTAGVWQRLVEDVVEDDSQSDKLEDVGEDGTGGEVLQVPDAADQDDWDQEDGYVDSVIPPRGQVGFNYLTNKFN